MTRSGFSFGEAASDCQKHNVSYSRLGLFPLLLIIHNFAVRWSTHHQKVVCVTFLGRSCFGLFLWNVCVTKQGTKALLVLPFDRLCLKIKHEKPLHHKLKTLPCIKPHCNYMLHERQYHILMKSIIFFIGVKIFVKVFSNKRNILHVMLVLIYTVSTVTLPFFEGACLAFSLVTWASENIENIIITIRNTEVTQDHRTPV